MSRPPQNLAEVVPSEVILQELESGVKALPTVARCPVNPEHKATLHPDGDAIWGVCPECGFTGDGIDILKAKYHTQSVESVVTRLEHSGVIKAVSRELVSDYQFSKVRKASWDRFIVESRRRLVEQQCDQRILDLFGAKPPFRQEWQEGFGKFVGTAKKQELCELLGIPITRLPDSMLLLPYYDMPGRMGNLRIVSYNARGSHFTDYPTNRPGGLFMLDTVAAGTEYVIAVDSPVMACHLQLKRMESVLKAMPIVAWHPDTRYWPISAKRVVFWAPVPTVDMFNQARKVPGAVICTPRNTYDFEELLKQKDVKNWVHHVMTNAKPWCSAVKEWLLSMPEDIAVQAARDLDISPLETGEILFECTQEEKTTLTGVLDIRSSIKNCSIGDLKVIDKDGSWWTHTEKGRLVRVTNAPFVLERSAHFAGKGSYLIGSVSVDSRTERFMAPAEELMACPTKWLRTFALRNGMGLVQTYPGWDRRLVEIATSFNPEKLPHTDGKAVVGWSDDLTRFSFPCVSLVNSRVDERDLGLPTDDMPCTKVSGHPTQRSAWKSFSECTPVNTVFWATLACIASNIGARFYGYPVRKIGVIGPQRHVALLATVFDLLTVQVNQPSVATKKLQEYSVHDVPAVLVSIGKFASFVSWLESSGFHNVMVSLNRSQAALLGGKDWVFVDAQDLSGPIAHLHLGTNLLADVVRMIQSNVKALDQIAPEVNILTGMYNWGNDHKCQIEEGVFTEARKLITQESIYGSLSVCDGFLYSLFSMIHDDQISVSRAGLSKKSGEVEISEKCVKVAKSVLQKMVLPVGTSTLTNELDGLKWLIKNSTNEWFLDRARWDELYEKWATLNEG